MRVPSRGSGACFVATRGPHPRPCPRQRSKPLAEADQATDMTPAGFFSRLLAFVADLIVLSAAIGASTWTMQSVEVLLQGAAWVELTSSLGLVVPFLIVAYYVGSWATFGQTVGKRLLGLRVVAADGGRVRPGRALLRFAGYFLSALPVYLGFAWVLVDRRRRGWHDVLAKTLVVYDRPGEARGASADLPHMGPSYALRPVSSCAASSRRLQRWAGVVMRRGVSARRGAPHRSTVDIAR